MHGQRATLDVAEAEYQSSAFQTWERPWLCKRQVAAVLDILVEKEIQSYVKIFYISKPYLIIVYKYVKDQ